MAPKLLCDVTSVDLEHVEHSIEDIRKINPHRHEFEQLTAILRFRPEEKIIIGLRDIRDDEFWVRGHIPGRPVFPGILMLEAAAQLCSFYCGKVVPAAGFLGFGGIDKVRFRGTVNPPGKMILVGSEKVLTPSRCLFATQAFLNDKLIFEATILGLRIREVQPL
jgi:3-hydroxyacyl-[acyl-carrier-protein] dehydratase